MSQDTISKEKFAVLIERAGLNSLDEAQTEDLRQAYKYVEIMAVRVRTPRGREAEPSLIFVLPKPDAA